MHKKNDLERDSISGLVLRIALPSMLAQFVNVLYSIVDRMYIGNIQNSGSLALAGVGVCGPIITLIGSFASLIGIGGAPLMSISMGEKNLKRAKDIIANSFLMLIILSAAITVALYPVRKPMLLFFGASEKTMPFADEYFSVYLSGTLFALLSVGMNQFIIQSGDMLVTCATIAQSFMLIVTMPLGGISGGTQTILSYNYGARLIDRVNEAQKKIILLCLAFTRFMTAVVWLCGGWFVRLFTSDKLIAENALWAIRVCTLSLLPLGVQYEIVDGFTAIGKVRFLPAIYGAKAAFFAEPVSDVLGPAVSIIIYFIFMKRVLNKRKIENF